jgi:hypothetical protein
LCGTFGFLQVSEEHRKVVEKLKATEIALENKNLEVKKINDEKKTALAAQYAAEATLRRVHAAQKDEDLPPIEAILAPLEAELRLACKEVKHLASLQCTCLKTCCGYKLDSYEAFNNHDAVGGIAA